MFDDFRPRRSSVRSGLLLVAVVGAALSIGVAAIAIASSPATAPTLPDQDLDVEFFEVETPEPEPELEVPEPVEAPRPEWQRPAAPAPSLDLEVPTEISDEELEESDRDLVDEGPSGPVGGNRFGREGGSGRGTPPPPPPPPEPPPPPRPRPSGPVMLSEDMTPPERIGPAPALAYPAAARDQGIQARVIVKCAILLSGEPSRCSVLRGHPALDASALDWVHQQRFTAARLASGAPVVVWRIFPINFRLTNL